jgi:protease-4
MRRQIKPIEMKHLALYCILLAVCVLPACQGTRVVIDFVPASDELTETVVLEDESASSFHGSKIALIDINGVIVDARRSQWFADGENPVSLFAESLKKAKDESSVRAVIVRINSPGGTVTASDVMYRELQDFKKRSGKPVVILMSDVAASGGYYVACAGDEILAHPTTVTGSIGVIMQTISFYEGMTRLGIHPEAITSGENKDVGSPLGPMSDEHRRILQGLVDSFYGNFLAVVKENRPAMSEDDIDAIRDGRVVAGQRAVELHLVDGLGGLRDAFQAAKQRAELDSARLVKYHRPMDYVGSAYAKTQATPGAPPQINLMQLNMSPGATTNQPNFYYLWDPSAW